MNNGHKIGLGFALLMLIVIGIRVYRIHEERVEANAPIQTRDPLMKVTDDDLVDPREIYPSTMKDVKALDGTSVWVKAGGQVECFVYNGHSIEFAKSGGFLLGADELHVKDFILANAPDSADISIPRGNKLVFMIFTRPDSPSTEYAAPVGSIDSSGYTFYTDTLFFYDDPHSLYKSWPQSAWNAIAQHQATSGMSETQVGLALGQIAKSDSNEPGDRTVQYYNRGKSVSVTFAHDKATSIAPTQY